MRALLRWTPAIVAITVVVLIAATFLLPASSVRHKSTATVELTDDVAALARSGDRGGDARREIEAQIRSLQTPEHEDATRAALGDLADDLIKFDVAGVEDSAVITITATARSTDVAVQAAQVSMELYLENRVEAEIAEHAVQLGPLRDQRDEQVALIDSLSAEIESIRDTAAPSELTILEARTKDAIDRLDTYNIAIQESEFFIETADGDARIVSNATPAVTERSSSTSAAVQLAGLAAILATLGAVGYHRTRGPLLLTEDVRATIGPDRNILAVVPKFNRSIRNSDSPLVVGRRKMALEAEAFRYLRSSIELSLAGVDRVSIAFTSASPNDGKTVTVANYSLAAARAGTDIVVLDTDLLNPSIATVFRVEAKSGFTQLLRGDYNPLANPTLIETTGMPVALITATRATDEKRAEFTSDAVHTVVNKVTTKWSIAALDCPPVLRVSDASTIAAACDHAVLVVRIGKTRPADVNAAIGLLEQSGASLLGVVITHATEKSSAYGNYSYGTQPRRSLP